MKFDTIIGNNEIKEYLSNILKQNKICQSYLFIGTEGIGKLLIAKEFAKGILCLNNSRINCSCKSCQCLEGQNHPDYFVVNEEGQTIKIDQIREITNKVIEQPIVSNKKVYIINDCDKMTIEAQNCLLKTLEEPPEFAVMILITSNENVLLNTIKSRCMTMKFKNIPKEELKDYAVQHLGYEQMTDNLVESFNGSIGKAIMQKQNQEKYLKIESLINDLSVQDIITIMNESKILYDKENINTILEYMMICLYSKKEENLKYINCIEKVNHCLVKLKRNSNFDMSLDTMLFEMWETIQK